MFLTGLTFHLIQLAPAETSPPENATSTTRELYCFEFINLFQPGEYHEYWTYNPEPRFNQGTL